MSMGSLRRKLEAEFHEKVDLVELTDGINALKNYLSTIDVDTDEIEAGVESDGNFSLRIPVADPDRPYVLKLLTTFMWFKEVDRGEDGDDTEEVSDENSAT